MIPPDTEAIGVTSLTRSASTTHREPRGEEGGPVATAGEGDGGAFHAWFLGYRRLGIFVPSRSARRGRGIRWRPPGSGCYPQRLSYHYGFSRTQSHQTHPGRPTKLRRVTRNGGCPESRPSLGKSTSDPDGPGVPPPQHSAASVAVTAPRSPPRSSGGAECSDRYTAPPARIPARTAALP